MQISRKDAQRIGQKIGGPVTAGRRKQRHQRFKICVDGRIWTTFGVSHGKHNSNLHILPQLGVSYTEAQQLASCHLSREWYITEKVRSGQ